MNLADLITAHKGARSYVKLEEACGGSPKAARLQQLAAGPPKNFPDPSTIAALARGLRVPATTVVLAAAESLGIDVRRPNQAVLDRFPAGVDRLSEEQLQALILMAQSLVDASVEKAEWTMVSADGEPLPIPDHSPTPG